MALKRSIYLALLAAMLSACTAKTTPQPTATRVPTATRMQPTATTRPAGQEVEMGLTAEGWPYKGNPKAEVTLWEFSEFQ